MPTHLTALRKLGVCTRLVEERSLSNGALNRCRALLIEAAPCLSQPSIAAIADFVRQGGLLIAAADSGRYDEIGRPRTGSGLWNELGLSGAPPRSARCGKGEVLGLDLPVRWETLVDRLRPARFVLAPAADAAILPYVDPAGRLLVYVCTDHGLPDDIRVLAPAGLGGRAVLCSPDRREPRFIEFPSP